MMLSKYLTYEPPILYGDTAFATTELKYQPVEFLLYFKYSKQQIILNVEPTEEGLWLASNPRIYTYGSGETSEEAVSDFLNMLSDLYQELLDSEEVLAPHLKQELDYLKTLITESYEL